MKWPLPPTVALESALNASCCLCVPGSTQKLPVDPSASKSDTRPWIAHLPARGRSASAFWSTCHQPGIVRHSLAAAQGRNVPQPSKDVSSAAAQASASP